MFDGAIIDDGGEGDGGDPGGDAGPSAMQGCVAARPTARCSRELLRQLRRAGAPRRDRGRERAGRRAAHRGMRGAGTVCDACFMEPDPFLLAVCDSGTCTAIDLLARQQSHGVRRRLRLSAGGPHVLRVRCARRERGHRVRPERGSYAALVCNPRAECPPCARASTGWPRHARPAAASCVEPSLRTLPSPKGQQAVWRPAVQWLDGYTAGSSTSRTRSRRTPRAPHRPARSRAGSARAPRSSLRRGRIEWRTPARRSVARATGRAEPLASRQPPPIASMREPSTIQRCAVNPSHSRSATRPPSSTTATQPPTALRNLP